MSSVREDRDGGATHSTRTRGRPKDPESDFMSLPRFIQGFEWLNVAWGRYNCEPCPVASQYDLVINVTNVCDVSARTDDDVEWFH